MGEQKSPPPEIVLTSQQLNRANFIRYLISRGNIGWDDQEVATKDPVYIPADKTTSAASVATSEVSPPAENNRTLTRHQIKMFATYVKDIGKQMMRSRGWQNKPKMINAPYRDKPLPNFACWLNHPDSPVAQVLDAAMLKGLSEQEQRHLIPHGNYTLVLALPFCNVSELYDDDNQLHSFTRMFVAKLGFLLPFHEKDNIRPPVSDNYATWNRKYESDEIPHSELPLTCVITYGGLLASEPKANGLIIFASGKI